MARKPAKVVRWHGLPLEISIGPLGYEAVLVNQARGSRIHAHIEGHPKSAAEAAKSAKEWLDEITDKPALFPRATATYNRLLRGVSYFDRHTNRWQIAYRRSNVSAKAYELLHPDDRKFVDGLPDEVKP